MSDKHEKISKRIYYRIRFNDLFIMYPTPTSESGFRTILADPPWRFANRTGKVAPEHRRLGATPP